MDMELHSSVPATTKDRINYRGEYMELRKLNQWEQWRKLYTRSYTIGTLPLQSLGKYNNKFSEEVEIQLHTKF
jgi:hypothetical protein